MTCIRFPNVLLKRLHLINGNYITDVHTYVLCIKPECLVRRIKKNSSDNIGRVIRKDSSEKKN